MKDLDDLCRNLLQTYQSDIKKITGKAIIYMPIKQDPNYCFYSVIDVGHCKANDYTIGKINIRSLIKRYRSSKTTNVLRYPEISFYKRPTKKQRIELQLLFYLNIYSYYMAYQIRKIEEKQKRRIRRNQELSLEGYLESTETVQ